MKHYRVMPNKEGNGWYVYDNHKGQIIKIVPIRKEARRIVNGLNEGWINVLKEEDHEAEIY